MARIAGINIPVNKRVEIGLTYIFGIGRSTAQRILAETGIDPNTAVKDLTEDEVIRLREAVENREVEGDLRREESNHVYDFDQYLQLQWEPGSHWRLLAGVRNPGLLLVDVFPRGVVGELGPWLREISARPGGPVVVVVSRGGLEENVEHADRHGLTMPIGIQRHWRTSRDYGIFAVPVAFAIDEDGVIVDNVAIGVDAIRRLVDPGTTGAARQGMIRAQV